MALMCWLFGWDFKVGQTFSLAAVEKLGGSVINVSYRLVLVAIMSSVVQAIQPFWETAEDGSRRAMSCMPTLKSGWRRVGKGSRGRRDVSAEEIPEMMDIS